MQSSRVAFIGKQIINKIKVLPVIFKENDPGNTTSRSYVANDCTCHCDLTVLLGESKCYEFVTISFSFRTLVSTKSLKNKCISPEKKCILCNPEKIMLKLV